MEKKIAIAMSGGVDSLVAASLLKKKGMPLFGIHFRTGFEPKVSDFTLIEKQLGIHITIVDLSREFQRLVVDYFAGTYLNGATPNPCIICNRSVKFGVLFEAARKLGADLLATGHYAGIKRTPSGCPVLVKGKDPVKEQSYFLSLLSHEQLDRTLFPLADMTKNEVTVYAREAGLTPLEKAESQDICFIPKGNFFDFIQNVSGSIPESGEIVTSKGEVVGSHKGLHRYTVGQRRGLNCPGPAPYYVKSIDMKTNRLVVGFKEELLKKSLYVPDLIWHSRPLTCPIEVTAKIRYSHDGAPALLVPEKHGAILKFHTSQYAVTPGQCAAFYQGEELLGAGFIQ